MSSTVSIILIFPSTEDEQERIREVNSFEIKPGYLLDLVSIEDNQLPNGWYGGSKGMLSKIYLGSYKYLNVPNFLEHLKYVNWEDSRDIQVLIREEDKNNFRYDIYSLST